ncbi:glycosyltransferase family 10 domain-containing protein [Pseudohalocynthiibacter aestuariivivens]|uniref:Glycosyltransferase family 10 domain-containing protein n=1 Tax=Pseudohalocynthiibacter aestuariivivens TaxID=1591409 RepID=A0ABV5JBT9_9RHOB|nr:glycosyltransferase family 10 [Pseudohalocynthiibacter aestuariivivens]MBS9718657.1 hypothetical protein [Pseudohalocynthiibacter aestuariivivens]
MTQIDDAPAIAVVPYGKWPTSNLANLSLDVLAWPIGRPKRLLSGRVRNLRRDDHLLTFPRKPVFLFPRFGVKAKISVMIVEPDAVHQRYVNWAKWLHWRFYKVLTKNASLLKKIENGEFYYLGSTFINEESQIDLTKSKMASLIASARRDLEGHKLRHQTVDHIRSEGLDVDIMGRGYRPFKEKADGLAPYRYSVVIENVREQSYFTEKLVDACLCKTVPIYWGAPNISDYFDVRGMIICNNAAEINTALKNMSVSDYEARLKWIEKNEQAARHHANNIERAALLIRKTIDKKQERL